MCLCYCTKREVNETRHDKCVEYNNNNTSKDSRVFIYFCYSSRNATKGTGGENHANSSALLEDAAYLSTSNAGHLSTSLQSTFSRSVYSALSKKVSDGCVRE